MESRACSNSHHIQAIRGGLVVKTMNVTHGRPSLVFKKIKDIYETEDANNQYLALWIPPKDDFRGLHVESNSEKIGSSCLSIGEGKTIKCEPDAYDCSSGDNERDSDSDDLGSGKMTLKQLKEMCKTKKRKLSKSVGLTEKNVETCSSMKQDHSNLQPEEDDFDLRESLSSWKYKITKKRKCINKHASTSSHTAIVVTSEEVQNSQDLLHSNKDLSAPVAFNVEVPEPDNLHCQLAVHVADDSSIACNEQVGSGGVVSIGMLETTNEYVVESGNSVSFTGEPINCAVIEASNGHLEHDSFIAFNKQASLCVAVSSETPETTDVYVVESGDSISFTREPTNGVCDESSFVCLEHSSIVLNEQVDSCGAVSCEMIETTGEYVMESRDSISYKGEPINCASNRASYDHMEHVDPLSLANAMAAGWKTTDVDNLKMTSYLSSDLLVSNVEKQEYTTSPPFHAISPDNFFPPKDHNLDVCESSQCLSPNEMSWQINGNLEDQLLDMATDNSLRSAKPSPGDGACVVENGGGKDDVPSGTEAGAASSSMSSHTSTYNSSPCPSPDSCSVSEVDDSPATNEKQSLMSVGSYIERNCSAGILPCDQSSDPCSSPNSRLVSSCDDSPTTDENQSLVPASDYTTRDLSNSEMVKNYHHPEVQHPPERLLSTRKAISPTSQERLCKAMSGVDLYGDTEYYKCRGKLCFDKQNENKTSDIEGAEVNNNAEVPEATINHKPIARKLKNNSRGSNIKSILKAPLLSRTPPRVITTQSSQSQSSSQSAIAFSQRQMNDIESLAMKLTKELKSMKDIVEDTFNSEGFSATSLKYNADEVKLAIENATKVEETSRKWLLMMARDCSRFCKIMQRCSQKDTTADSGSTVQKERKKITFADEAGGKLCHVKLFENGMASMGVNGE